MDNIFVISAIISIIYSIVKFLEMKFIDSENKKPIKFIIRDALIVYFSVIFSNFLIEQTFPNVAVINKTQPNVFTTEPSF